MRADDGEHSLSRWDGLSPEVQKFLTPRELPPMGIAVISGVKAGIVGSFLAFLLLSHAYQMSGGDIALPVRVLAFRLSGDANIAAGSLGVGICMIMILATGAGLGALFGVIMSKLIGRIGFVMAAGVGMVYGLLVWIVVQYIVLYYLAPDALMFYDQHVLMWSHVAYGACLGIFGDAYR